jgi:hypothetical protein
MAARDETLGRGYPDNEASMHVRQHVHDAGHHGFTVDEVVLDDIAVGWRERTLAGVDDIFSKIALAGLAGVNAALHDITARDPDRFVELQKRPLFTETNDDISLNPEIVSILPSEPTAVGSERWDTLLLLNQGIQLISLAKAASGLQATRIPETSYTITTQPDKTLKSGTRIYEVEIPDSDRKVAGSDFGGGMGGYPLRSVAMRYEQTVNTDGRHLPTDFVQFHAGYDGSQGGRLSLGGFMSVIAWRNKGRLSVTFDSGSIGDHKFPLSYKYPDHHLDHFGRLIHGINRRSAQRA